MIPGSHVLRQVPTWQSSLAQAINDPAELLSLLNLGDEWLAPARAAARLFPLRVPRGFVARMRQGDPHDPLLRQVLPLGDECLTAEGFGADPVGDLAAMTVPGVLHKYQGRVLLTATGACAVHCRYCFRRHFPYTDANPAIDQWQRALDYIAHDASISEVILSGGDPLSLSERRLVELVERLQAIAHVKRLRFHTRLPIVLPERVNAEFLNWFGAIKLKIVVVVHVNHANEIDDSVRVALTQLQAAGASLLNQSVLLRGVNDKVDDLARLSEVLFESGVLPYYLHLLDKVQGAAHFDVQLETAQQLMTQLQVRLPGYLVPRLVREISGAPGKVSVF
ncbi:MAG: EF-P beta-lysylation protein EpmB [Gammaproteobacteria bacterium]|nr:EF-P beta-lysylation protein EpmB [Gammaproteobacteria bacterium]